MSFSPPEYLRHILDETTFLIEHAHGLDFASFCRNEIIRRAFVRSLEIIGEATKQLPADFRDAHPQVDWRGMAGMRDRVIHGYFAVNDHLVWEAVSEKVPVLHDQIRTILRQGAF